jgi:hypothetical protein
VKFNRTDLIARVQAEIARREQAAAEANAKAAAEHDKKLTEYVRRTSDAWSRLATTIRARIRAGRPITVDDIPVELRGGWHGGDRIDTWRSNGAAVQTANVDALTTLLHLLEATTEEEITTASLERVGFRTAELFRTR